jgi:phosphoglycolate phosphatase/pyrophosphatase PpaX
MGVIKAILFDLDGTLLDSFSLHYSAYEVMFARFGIAMEKERFLSSYSPDWYQTYRAFGLSEEHWQTANDVWLAEAESHRAELFPGVSEVIEKLSSEYRLGVVTSGSRSRVVRDMERLGLNKYFSTLVTGDDISEPKPAPEGLELALRNLHLSPKDAIYVGDAHADFEMSRAAGVPFIGVSSELENLTYEHPEYEIHVITAVPDVIAKLSRSRVAGGQKEFRSIPGVANTTD